MKKLISKIISKSMTKKIKKPRSTKKNKKGGVKTKRHVTFNTQYPSQQPNYPSTPGQPSSILPVPTMFSKTSELVFNDKSIWTRIMTPDKLKALKSNILKLANNQICRNITEQFNLFNASLDRKKINTECFLLVIISILTQMLKPHCVIIIKGGLAVQFSLNMLFKLNNINDEDIFSLFNKRDDVQTELSNIFKLSDEYAKDEQMLTTAYITNDIDILIHPIEKNASKETKNYYATQISNALLWLFEDIGENNENIHVISVQDKTNEPEPNKQLIKVSMAEPSGSKKFKYTAIVDINIHLPDKKYYEPTYIYPITTDSGIKGTFIFVSIKPLMLDRLQHIIYYKDTIRELINTMNSLAGDTKISDIFGSHPDFKYLMSNYRSTNALIEGLLIVEITKKNTNSLRDIKQSILDEYLQELGVETSDKELITQFLFAKIV
jgi:hypothetical protein